MSSRNPNDLTPETKSLWEKFDSEMKKEGIDYILTCTKRSSEEQANLYAQGRTKPGKIVTWVKHSKHEDGLAFDIVIMVHGKCVWDTSNPLWKKAGEIGETVGLIWGGSWHTPDYPHFQNSK